MTITRRGLLAGIFACAAGPAIVRSSSLMPIVAPKIILPKHFSWDPDVIILRSNRKYLDEAVRKIQMSDTYGKRTRGGTSSIYHVDECAFMFR